MARALVNAGWTIDQILRRGDDPSDAASGVDAVIIATPDAAIASVAATVEPAEAVLVHLSGATGLEALAPHRAASVHPLAALPDEHTGAARLMAGGPFAVAGDPFARELVAALGGRPFEIADDQRALYHAAAAVASNHVVALLAQVERLAEASGAPLWALLEMAAASVDNVATLGAAAAITGPASRGDQDTIDRHLAALDATERELYSALALAAAKLGGSTISVEPNP